MVIMENIYHDYSHSISQYLGKMVGSTGHPFSSIIGNVDLESLAIATQFLKMKMMRGHIALDLSQVREGTPKKKRFF